jgi:Tol biopolymer transport system component
VVSLDLRLDTLLSIPALFGPRVSPDGKWVAWSWSRVGPAADVFAAPADVSQAPLRLTETVEGDTMVVSWTSDSDAVLVSQDNDGDERVRLFRVRLADPGVMEPLTAASPNHYLRGGQLHKDGRWLIYAANLDAESGEEIETDRLYRHDLRTGEKMVLARPEKGSIPWPELNRLGTHVLYSRNELHPAGQQVWLVDIDGLEDREILNFGPRVKVSASWFSDGRRVLFVAEAESYRRLGVEHGRKVCALARRRPNPQHRVLLRAAERGSCSRGGGRASRDEGLAARRAERHRDLTTAHKRQPCTAGPGR